jgi:hypothetical protein
MREACGRRVHPSHIHFHSALLLHFIGFLEILPRFDSYTLIHVHGELTDVAVALGRSCAFFGSYPIGIDTILRKIAHAAHVDVRGADSLLTLSISGHLDGDHAAASLKVIEDVSQGWSSECVDLFKQNECSIAVPSPCILSARIHEEFFTKSLKKAYPTHAMERLTHEELATHVTSEPHIERQRLTILYASAIHSVNGQSSIHI